MIEYGYINEEGRFTSKLLKEYTEQYFDEKNKLYTRTITVNQQIEELIAKGWKPVDQIDETQIQNCEENYRVRVFPYDVGNRIAYSYKKVVDKDRVQCKIDDLIKEVAATDYQVRKCQEYSLVGKPLPYDIQAIHEEAEAIRIKIRELEKLI